MNKKQKTALENSSEIKEEKRFDFNKIAKWGIGLIIIFMAVAYLAGFITFGTTPPIEDSAKREYFKADSVATATSAKKDSVDSR